MHVVVPGARLMSKYELLTRSATVFQALSAVDEYVATRRCTWYEATPVLSSVADHRRRTFARDEKVGALLIDGVVGRVRSPITRVNAGQYSAPPPTMMLPLRNRATLVGKSWLSLRSICV